MKSRITRIAAAAVIIIAVIVGLHHYTGSIDVASPAFAEMVEAMKRMPWIHTIVDIDAVERKGQMDSWMCFEPSIMIIEEPEGTVRYVNFSEETQYTYNPQDNTITISTIPDTFSAMGPRSPFEVVERMIETLQAGGAEITREESVLDGRAVEIIHGVSDTEDIRMVRDVERNLLVSCDRKILGNTPERGTATMRFDYPEQGPPDIYALGVPEDAALVDTRPRGSLKDLTKEIQRRFENGFGDHIAVVLESSGSREDPNNPDYPNMIVVMRRLGRLRRLDRYHALDTSGRQVEFKSLYEDIKDDWPNLTIRQILSLEDNEALLGQMLFDGKYTTSCTRIRGKVHKSRWRGDPSRLSSEFLPAIVWTNPFMLTMGNSSEKKTIEPLPADPDHAQLAGLRVRTTAKDKNKKYDSSNKPRLGTDDYWFDPAKDYILVERIHREEIVQQGEYRLLRSIVTETGRTSDGKWYPGLIRTEHFSVTGKGKKLNRIREKRLLLDTNPTFKQGIFDASSLLE